MVKTKFKSKYLNEGCMPWLSQPWHYQHFGPDHSLMQETILCIVRRLAAFSDSTNRIPVEPLSQAVTAKSVPRYCQMSLKRAKLLHLTTTGIDWEQVRWSSEPGGWTWEPGEIFSRRELKLHSLGSFAGPRGLAGSHQERPVGLHIGLLLGCGSLQVRRAQA